MVTIVVKTLQRECRCFVEKLSKHLTKNFYDINPQPSQEAEEGCGNYVALEPLSRPTVLFHLGAPVIPGREDLANVLVTSPSNR